MPAHAAHTHAVSMVRSCQHCHACSSCLAESLARAGHLDPLHSAGGVPGHCGRGHCAPGHGAGLEASADHVHPGAHCCTPVQGPMTGLCGQTCAAKVLGLRLGSLSLRAWSWSRTGSKCRPCPSWCALLSDDLQEFVEALC